MAKPLLGMESQALNSFAARLGQDLRPNSTRDEKTRNPEKSRRYPH
jgi:hypothetical protein